jgi:hypothetical protein
MGYRIIAEAAMLAHFFFLAFVAFGGFLAWIRPTLALLHIPVALYGLGIALIGWQCPLTHVENWGRVNAGQSPIASPGFTEHYLGGVLYPSGQLELAHTGAGVVVALSYGGALWWHLRRRRAGGLTAASRWRPEEATRA